MKNKNLLIITSSVLLLFNGIPALLAGGNLISDPTGAGLDMDVSILETSPFKNFLVPGIILFLMNGVCSFIVLASIIRNSEYYPRLILCQGLILTMWIAFQIMLITEPSWLQLTYGFAGTILTGIGLLLDDIRSRERIYHRA